MTKKSVFLISGFVAILGGAIAAGADTLAPLAKLKEIKSYGVSMTLAFEAPAELSGEMDAAKAEELLRSAMQDVAEEAEMATVRGYLYPAGAAPEKLPYVGDGEADKAAVWYLRDPSAAGWKWSLEVKKAGAEVKFQDCNTGGHWCNSW